MMKRFLVATYIAIVLSAAATPLLAGTITLSFWGEFQIEDGGLASLIGSSIPYYGKVRVDEDVSATVSTDLAEFYPYEVLEFNIAGNEFILDGAELPDRASSSTLMIQDGTDADDFGDNIRAGASSGVFTNLLDPINLNKTTIQIDYIGIDSAGAQDIFSGTDVERVKYATSTSMYSQYLFLSLYVNGEQTWAIDYNINFAISETGVLADGYVISIDGLEFLSIFGLAEPNYSRYLYDAISPGWIDDISEKVGVVGYSEWSRRIVDSGPAVLDLIDRLETLSAIAKKENAPLVVLAHSWGTVLTYIAASLSDNILIDNFITLGSPLNAQNIIYREYTEAIVSSFGGLDTYISRRPSNIKSWTNYWAGCDNISGPIQRKKRGRRNYITWVDSVGIENVEIPATGLTLGCHKEYFEDINDWDDILSEVYWTK